MTIAPQTVRFGEWLPDLPDHENPGVIEAKNCVPEAGGYRSLPSLTTFADALTGACLGNFWAVDAAGTTYNFAGDATKLYRLVSNSWTDVSGTSAPYASDNWEFTRFGDRIIAASSGDQLQKFDMGIDSVFADLTNGPTAKRIATIRNDFVMLGNIDALGPNYVQWSGYNNSELWTPSIASQSDYQELRGRGGEVVKIVPGPYATIFSERSIHIAQYAGPPIIFQIDEVETKSGTPAPNSVVKHKGLIWYYGWDGFYVFDGRVSKPISENKVTRWFQKNASQDALSSMRGAIDRVNNLVVWAFKTSASAANNNRLIIYNWASKRWAYAEVETQIIDDYVTEGYTLDTLDTILPGGIDADSILIDSDVYQGGILNLIAFDSTNTAATFSGTGLSATITTRELSSTGEGTLYVSTVRPMIECITEPDINIEIGYRKTLRSNVSYTTPKMVNTKYGRADIRKDARYIRFRVTINGCFEHAKGLKPDLTVTGGD